MAWLTGWRLVGVIVLGLLLLMLIATQTLVGGSSG